MKVAASLPVWMTRVGGEDGVGLGVHVGRTVLVGVNIGVIVGIWTGDCEPLRERTPGKQPENTRQTAIPKARVWRMLTLPIREFRPGVRVTAQPGRSPHLLGPESWVYQAGRYSSR